MSDRPDLDKAIEIAQAGGFKVTGGKYAPVDPETGKKPTLMDKHTEGIELVATDTEANTDPSNPPKQSSETNLSIEDLHELLRTYAPKLDDSVHITGTNPPNPNY